MTDRVLQRTVRSQLVRTNRRAAVALNPERSRRCSGTCSNAVDAQIASTRPRPILARPGAPSGGVTARKVAVANSMTMRGTTIHAVRRWCSVANLGADRRSAKTKRG